MNKIELILDNSIFEINQFNANQIAVLNEMVDNNISEEQVCIIAHPSVNELSYSVIYEYLSKGNSITSVEYQKYLNIDVNRINDIIVNVYLGKLHGLSDEQINLYAQRSVYNIKIARLLVEKSKDASPEHLNQLVTGKFGTKSIIGKQAIQDYINGELDLSKLLCISTCQELTQNNYEYIKQINDSRILSIITDGYKKNILTTNSLTNDMYFNQSKNIDNNNKCVSYVFKPNNIILHFDNIDTYNKLYKLTFNRLSLNHNVDNNDMSFDHFFTIICEYYKYDFSINNNFIKMINYTNIPIHFYSEGEIEEDNTFNDPFYTMLQRYLYKDNKRRVSNIVSNLDEYFYVFMNTHGFRDYLIAKYKDKVSEEGLNLIKQGKSSLDYLFSLYKTKKDKETEIPYLEEHLKEANNKQLIEIICMKENKCSNNEIHLYIENYLTKTECLPSMYFNKDSNYNKYWSISEFLKLNDLDFDFNTLYNLKEIGCTDEDVQFVIDNKLDIGSSPIQKRLIDMFKDYGASNIQYAYDKYITESNKFIDDIISNYNYAKSIFKDKVKCIGYYTNNSAVDKIDENLVKYIDNFDDDTLLKIRKQNVLFTEFCLKMSPITTDYNVLKNMYTSIEGSNRPKIKEFTQKDEKVTKDVVIKFCKDAKIDVPKGLFENQVEDVIEKSVEYFGSSKNFKPIQYDDETIYVDIIGNKELKGSHIITFNKEENDNYEYIFEIAHKEDTLTYTSKITTKKDVTEAINKSIALIENIDEYKEYTEELQEMLKSI